MIKKPGFTKLDWLGIAQYVASGGLGAVWVTFGVKGAAYGSIVVALAGLITRAYSVSTKPATSIVAGAPTVDPTTHQTIGTNVHEPH